MQKKIITMEGWRTEEADPIHNRAVCDLCFECLCPDCVGLDPCPEPDNDYEHSWLQIGEEETRPV